MEEEHKLKHVCKFCSKSFSCGRSLGGHMRSHMINDITAQADGTKLTKKKLPSLIINTAETSNSYVLRENPKKTWRIPDDHHQDQDTSIHEKSCKVCGKVFQSWKALFGHMKFHSTEKEKSLLMDEQEQEQDEEDEEEEHDSWTSVMDSQQSDNETAAPNQKKKKKRSQRRTRKIMGTNTANSSSSLCFHASSSVTEIEQEQEEVAISLMMLSRDVCGNSVAESSDKTEHSVSEFSRKKNSGFELGKRKLIDTRFECTTCNKIFHSYQALGGHKASHKKNKGCYASTSENSIETVQLDETNKLKNKGHGCPICFKVFPSGQALGGHKRSHLIEAKNNQNLAIPPPIRDFLDLNLPAPAEEDNNNGLMGFNQWWISSTHKHESLVGLISN